MFSVLQSEMGEFESAQILLTWNLAFETGQDLPQIPAHKTHKHKMHPSFWLEKLENNLIKYLLNIYPRLAEIPPPTFEDIIGTFDVYFLLVNYVKYIYF